MLSRQKATALVPASAASAITTSLSGSSETHERRGRSGTARDRASGKGPFRRFPFVTRFLRAILFIDGKLCTGPDNLEHAPCDNDVDAILLVDDDVVVHGLPVKAT
jgi:hypothetical protein